MRPRRRPGSLLLLSFFLFSFFLFGCASTGRKVLLSYQKHLKAQQWDQALVLAQGPKFYSKDRDALLKELELGMLHHLKGRYRESQKHFDKAKHLSDELFTVSLSQKALKSVGSDSLDSYYGEIYERSMLRFYSALNHLLLSEQQGLPPSERRRHLDSARAFVVEWNATLKNWKSERSGKTVYKDDLLAKTFGAFVHRQVGGRDEEQIAALLDQQAQKVFFQNYNVYPSLNHLHEKFKDDFEKLPQLKRSEVKKNYVSPTPLAKGLVAYLKDTKKKAKKDNVTVLVQYGLIAPKYPKKYHFPLDFTHFTYHFTPDALSIADFCVLILGLSLYGGAPGIEFELPAVENRPVENRFFLEVSQRNKTVATHPVVLVNPLSEMAQEAVREHALATRLRVGVRLASKYAVAIFLLLRPTRRPLMGGCWSRPLACWP